MTTVIKAKTDAYLAEVRVAILEAMAEQEVTYADLARALDVNSGIVWTRLNQPDKFGDWPMSDVVELKRILNFRWRGWDE